MADDQEKTEEPTAKKLEDARAEGNVPKSQDISGVLILIVAILSLWMMFSFIAERLLNLVRYYFSLMNHPLEQTNLISTLLKLKNRTYETSPCENDYFVSLSSFFSHYHKSSAKLYF